MSGLPLLHAFWLFLCLLIVIFYLLRLINGHRWLCHIDVENEVGHGLMAAGMAWMLAPENFLSPSLLFWSSVLFAFATAWWTGRLLVHKPLVAFLLGKTDQPSAVQSDAIHILMHSGMCYMFLLMGNMALSMSSPARCVNSLFFAAFAFLTVFYGREVVADLQQTRRDGLQLGANVAHVLMSAIMCWMFLDMIYMTMTMSPL